MTARGIGSLLGRSCRKAAAFAKIAGDYLMGATGALIPTCWSVPRRAYRRGPLKWLTLVYGTGYRLASALAKGASSADRDVPELLNAAARIRINSSAQGCL